MLDPTALAGIVFLCVFGGALLGMWLRTALPEHHLNPDSKYIVKMGMGLVATMVALLLGMLIASAKNFYDSQAGELKQISAKIIFLDHLLAQYGFGAEAVRGQLRMAVGGALDQGLHARYQAAAAAKSRTPAEDVYEGILELSPKDDFHWKVQQQALVTAAELGNLRWMMFAEKNTSVSVPMLIMVIFWLTIIFISFGLFAPPNATVIVSLFVSSLSVSIAVWLILEMYTPYDGWIQVSVTPLRTAFEQLSH